MGAGTGMRRALNPHGPLCSPYMSTASNALMAAGEGEGGNVMTQVRYNIDSHF